MYIAMLDATSLSIRSCQMQRTKLDYSGTRTQPKKNIRSIQNPKSNRNPNPNPTPTRTAAARDSFYRQPNKEPEKYLHMSPQWAPTNGGESGGFSDSISNTNYKSSRTFPIVPPKKSRTTPHPTRFKKRKMILSQPPPRASTSVPEVSRFENRRYFPAPSPSL